MHRFRSRLVPGKKRPYLSWTFLVIPESLAKAWSPGQKAVRGIIAGHAFKGLAARGEGVVRVPLTQEFRERASVACGDVVDAAVELDAEPRPVRIPVELQALFDDDRSLKTLFDALAPSMRRAWADHVAGAKNAETRARRAQKARDGIRARSYP